jgi:small subunit ribosomal protein S27Ae
MSKLYEIKDDKIIRKRRNCPKCGDGTFLGKHKNRESCGKCGYTEFTKKDEAPAAKAPKVDKPAEKPPE